MNFRYIIPALFTFSIPAQADELRSIAARHGVPYSLARAVLEVESGGRCSARNGSSFGVMQVKPATARSVGVHGNLYHCQTGMEAGVRYLALALRRGGAGCAGVSLYQRGIYARPVVCTAYGQKVMRAAARFR